MSIKDTKNEKGIGLVETIVALGIAVVVITSLVSLSIYSLRSSLQSKLLLQGTKLANEELERLRAKRDGTSWVDFVNALTGVPSVDMCVINDCYIDSILGIQEGQETLGSGAETITRYFRVSNPDPGSNEVNPEVNVLRFSISVNWRVGSEDRATFIYSDLSNWRN
jgi:Tfp pilus assembly protein PilV